MCSHLQLLLETDQASARDLYWQAVTECSEQAHHEEARHLLEAAIRHNPHVAEPHIVLAQLHLHR